MDLMGEAHHLSHQSLLQNQRGTSNIISMAQPKMSNTKVQGQIYGAKHQSHSNSRNTHVQSQNMLTQNKFLNQTSKSKGKVSGYSHIQSNNMKGQKQNIHAAY